VTPDTDLAIVGSGFGGSMLAMVGRRLGLRVTLVERGQHPRFAIGESASPLAGVLIEQLADRYDLPRLEPLSSYGPWRRTYPHVVCGLKRGFTYFKHDEGKAYVARADRSSELLVAASPSDEVSDTHWLRADVDQFLVNEAIALGAGYLDRTILDALDWDEMGHAVLSGSRGGQRVRIRARTVVDATGPRGFLSRALGIDGPGFTGYPPTQALYSHFTGVARCEELPAFGFADRAAPQPPYAVDAAALHHVFDGGWMWVLRFDNGVTSAGVAVDDWLARELRLADGEPAWKRLLARYPTIATQFADAEPIREFTWMPQVSYRAAAAAGERWAMLPSAAAFVDPLFSSGIPMTLVGIERLGRALEIWRDDGQRSSGPRWRDYGPRTLAEADHTARFVAGCYAAFPRFETFAAYSMFYFVAASFSEMARRLDAPSRGFLCQADPEFAEALASLSPATGHHRDLAHMVAASTDRLNIAGLCEPAKRNWFGVDLEDTVRGASKLGVTPERVREMLVQSGLEGAEA
jgi:FADH2 O2-dependent halogenase